MSNAKVNDVKRFEQMLDAECGLSPLTIEAYTRDVQAFLLFCGSSLVIPIKVSEYFQNLDRHNSTLRRISTSLRRFFEFVKHPELTNAVPSVKRLVASPKPLTEIECESLRSAMTRRDPTVASTALRTEAIFETLYGCGLRVSELCDLRLPALSLSVNRMRVMGKGRRERMVPIPQQTRTAIEDYLTNWRPIWCRANVNNVFVSLNGTPMSRTDISRMIGQRAWQSRISHASAHTLRHSHATHRMDHNDELANIQADMGHSNLSITQQYLAVSSVRMRQVMERCHPSFQEKNVVE